MELAIEHLLLADVEPNPWNPNKQNERQYQAEIESILDNGFISPILVRKVDKGYQIIDGEHRWKALADITERGLTGKNNISDLVNEKTIPAVVLNISDAQAKKLTIVMNETRGQADLAELGALLAEICLDLGDTLSIGLPYTEAQMKELMSIADFNWQNYDGGGMGNFESGDEGYKVIALLSPDAEQKWVRLIGSMKDSLPDEPKAKAGALIAYLLSRSEM